MWRKDGVGFFGGSVGDLDLFKVKFGCFVYSDFIVRDLFGKTFFVCIRVFL